MACAVEAYAGKCLSLLEKTGVVDTLLGYQWPSWMGPGLVSGQKQRVVCYWFW